jgi:hypothetical protein
MTEDCRLWFGQDHRQAAERAAADIEGHSTAAELGQPGRLTPLVGIRLIRAPVSEAPSVTPPIQARAERLTWRKALD